MRTGAIFARGSCRALKWMALLGVVFALGAGSAAAQAKPNKPVLTVKGSSATEVTLTWTVPSGGPAITGFQTQAGDAPVAFTDTSPTPADVTPAGGGTRTIDLAGATAGTRRSYRVGAIGAGGTTWSDVKHFTTEDPPAAISDLAVTTGDQMATLTWGRVTGARYYEYNFKLGADAAEDFTAAADARNWKRVSGGSGATRQTISELVNGSSYAFGVRAVNNGGSTIADPRAVAIPSGMPGAPTDLTVEVGTPAAGKVTVTLSWTAPASDGGNAIKDYEYEIVDFRDWRLIGSTNDYFDITGLDEDMAAGYTYRVRAVNDNGVGPAVGSDGTTGGSGPTTPQTPGTAYGKGAVVDLSIAGAGEKNIDGTRMHIGEGQHTSVTVTLEWTDEELESIWTGIPAGGKPDPADVVVKGMIDPMDQKAWLSLAELEHDVNIFSSGRTIPVPIPAVPKTARSARSTGTVQFTVGQDDDAEAEAFWLVVDNQDAFGSRRNKFEHGVFVIEDDEVQGISLSGASGTIYEGGPNVQFTVQAKPSRVDLDLAVRFDLEDVTGQTVASRENTISVDDSMIGTGSAAKATVTLSLDKNDGNRMDDKLKLMASVVPYALDTGAYKGITSQEKEFDVYDVHRLPPLTVMPMMTELAEGGEVELTLTVNRNPTDTIATGSETLRYTLEELSIMLAEGAGNTALDRDYDIMTNPVVVPKHGGKGDWTQTVKVKVMALTDDEIDTSMLMLDAKLSGTVAANGPVPADYPDDMSSISTSITITDSTDRLVWARSMDEVMKAVYDAKNAAAGANMMLNPDEDFSIEGLKLFGHDEMATVVYSVSSSNTAAVEATISANGEMVMIEPMMAGEAEIMVTATATPKAASGVKIIDQTKPNVAQVKFPLSVVRADLSFSVMGPDDMNLIEGGRGAKVTVMANRMLAGEETAEIMLMRDGASTAVDADYTVMPEMAMLKAGDQMAEFTVMAVEDGMVESGGGMTDMLMLFPVVDGSQMADQAVKFYIWDMAVPALPVIAQLLLAAFLAIGGYRRYLRR